jgi:hypothetical protein
MRNSREEQSKNTGNSAVELQGRQQCRARPTPIRCDRYFVYVFPVTCHHQIGSAPAILMKVERACTLALPMHEQCSVYKHSRSCYDRSRATVAQRTYLYNCLHGVKRSLYLTYN